MFIGSINRYMWAVLETAAGQWKGLPVYVACSGNFTVERIRTIGTTAFTDKPVSMKYRGMFDVHSRSEGKVNYLGPAGRWNLQEGSLFYIEAGRVRLPEGKEAMTGPFIDECAAFTGDGSVHDDRVDGLSMACSVWSWKGGARDIKVG